MQETILSSDDIDINVETLYIDKQSDPELDRYVYSYTISITNHSNISVQLLSRYWLIKDSNLKTEEVVGEGVVGEKPILNPGESFQYNSGAVLETDMGTMEGFYYFEYINSDNEKESLRVPIPVFLLSIPRQIH